MKKTIYSKFDKTRIAELEPVLFDGRVVEVLNEGEAERAVKYLLSQSELGIDTETRPSFQKGPMNPVSLLQVSDRQVCYLFRLNHTGISPSIRRLLEDATVPKIGLSLHDDLMQLHRRHDFVTGNFIDLQDHVREIGIEDMSLQKIYANLFHRKISKRQRLTNWEADVLTERQKLYAATDAWSCIMIYDELQRLKQTNDYELIKVESNG